MRSLGRPSAITAGADSRSCPGRRMTSRRKVRGIGATSMNGRWRAWPMRSAVRPEDYVGDDERRNEQVVREGFLAKARRHLNRLPLAQETVAMYFCLLDPGTPLWVK